MTTNTSASLDTTFHRCTIESPVGPLTLIADDGALCALLWAGDEHPPPTWPAPVHDVATPADHPILAMAVEQLGEYFAGDRIDFDLPLRPAGTPFQLAVWEVLRTIPYGHTISYGEQAAQLGDPHKARAVGAANGRNPLSIIVPCHRVRGADGSLTGFGGGLANKAWLLDHERLTLMRAD